MHTPRKTYHADAGNIASFTKGRLTLNAAQIAQRYPAPAEPEGLSQPFPLHLPLAPDPHRPNLLLITEEDFDPQDFDLSALRVQSTRAVSSSHPRSPRAPAPQVAQFGAAALADILTGLGIPDAPN